MNKYEIITFQDNTFKLDVNVSPDGETVWLTQKQMAKLYGVSIDNIGLHIKNIFTDFELDNSVSEESSVTASDGKRYVTKLYNLDMILAVGYRVKSKNAISFRKWATSILKNYMLNKSDDCKECKQHIINLESEVYQIKNSLNHELLYVSGDELKGYLSIKRFLETAKKSIYIFDNYFDSTYDEVLKGIDVDITIVTNIKNTKVESNDIYKVIKTNDFHDRYIFVDDICYVLGCSFKDIGKKTSTAVRLYHIKLENILKDK